MKIRVAQWGGRHIIYLPVYIAHRLGFFSEAGLDIDIYPAGNDNETYNEVIKGRAEFGIGDPSFVAIGAEKGEHARVVAVLVNNICNWGITHHPEIKEIRDPTDFVGLRVGCYPRPSTTYTLISGLKRRYSTFLKNMQIIETPIEDPLSALITNRADLVVDVEPMVSIAVRQGLRIVLSVGSFYKEFLFTGITASLKTIEERPEIVANFVRALQKGLIVTHQDPERTRNIAAELFPTIPADCLNDAITRMIETKAWPESIMIDPNAWLAALQLRVEVGELKKLSHPEKLIAQRFSYRALVG